MYSKKSIQIDLSNLAIKVQRKEKNPPVDLIHYVKHSKTTTLKKIREIIKKVVFIISRHGYSIKIDRRIKHLGCIVPSHRELCFGRGFDTMNDYEILAVLLHELGHILTVPQLRGSGIADKREVVAESFSYLILSYFGVHSLSTYGYINRFGGVSYLRNHQKLIVRTASRFFKEYENCPRNIDYC